MHMQQQDGFTLVEVMAALAIIGFVLTALASLEIALTKTTAKATVDYDRAQDMVRFLQKTGMRDDVEKKQKIAEKMESHDLRLVYQRLDVPKESAISKIKNMTLERVDARWPGVMRERTDTIIRITYTPEKEEHETGNKPS